MALLPPTLRCPFGFILCLRLMLSIFSCCGEGFEDCIIFRDIFIFSSLFSRASIEGTGWAGCCIRLIPGRTASWEVFRPSLSFFRGETTVLGWTAAPTPIPAEVDLLFFSRASIALDCGLVSYTEIAVSR